MQPNRSKGCLVICISLAVISHPLLAGAEMNASVSREHFAMNMATLKIGMPKEAIIKCLGKPDDIRTQKDTPKISTAHTDEIWCYGTNGHLTFPTLGQVYIDDRGMIQYLFGNQPMSSALKAISEDDLREFLRLVDQAPGFDGHSYNPLPVIQIVNALQPLGKDLALAIVDEYLRIASDFESPAREGLFLVLRVLFDVAKMPPMLVGAPTPAEPTNPSVIPRFPIAIQDDIPFMLVEGYVLGGMPQPVEDHIDFFRDNGTLRIKPLIPTNQPLMTLDKLKPIIQSSFKEQSERETAMLINQLLRLVDSVYRLKEDTQGIGFPYGKDTDLRYTKISREFSKVNVYWDSSKKKYLFQDGSCLPARAMKH